MVSIIILVVLFFVCIVILFLGSSTSFRKIKASYKRFLENKENYSDTKLKKLRSQLIQELAEFNRTIPRREYFIENNRDPELSEYADELPRIRLSLIKDKRIQADFRDMLQEVEHEIARRKHFRKYE